MASLTLTVRRRAPAMPAHSAPLTMAARAITRIITPPGRLPSRARAAPPAPMAPMTICPSPPTLISPARAGTATARAARISGAALMKISPTEAELVTVDCHMSLYMAIGLAPLVMTKAPKMKRAAT